MLTDPEGSGIIKINIKDMEPVTAMLIASGVSAAGQMYTNWRNRRSVDRTNESQERMFDRQLAYNSESAQMARRMAAGLHPMTMAGVQPSEAPTAPDYESYDLRNPFGGAVDTGQSVAQTMMQQKQLYLQDKSLDVQKLNASTEIAKIVGDLTRSGLTSDEITSLFHRVGVLQPDQKLDAIQAGEFQLESLKNSILSLKYSNDLKRKDLEWFDRLRQAEFDLANSSKDLNVVKQDTDRSIQKLNEVKRRECEQAIQNMSQQLRLLVQQTYVASYDAGKAQSMMKYIREDTEHIHNILVNDANVSSKDANTYILRLVLSALSQFSPNVGFIGKF